MKHFVMTTALVAATAGPALAQNRIDGQSPAAPELAAYGPLAVGVRRLDFVNPDQVDVLALYPRGERPAVLPRYDRPLTVEMWYPALEGSTGVTTQDTFQRDRQPIQLEGRAIRDAPAADVGGPLPLVLLSHGYPGNRFLMSHLAENIASKGYVVASIDHTDSTYRDQNQFGSTLVNRPLDQLFVLDQMARLNDDATSGVAGLIDADNTGLIGYSMGGYGAIITAGGGLTEKFATELSFGAPNGTAAIHQQGSATHEALPDPRIKTAVAIGPWGKQLGEFAAWDEEGLAGIEIPMLFIAGSADTVSGYEDGPRAIWEGARNVDRSLLTFEGAGHNAAAPIPAPQESFYFNEALNFNVSEHYTTEGWDTVFMNNVAQHFVTSWLDVELKGDAAKASYLDLIPVGRDGVFDRDADGTPGFADSYWKGFQEGTADRLRFERLAAGEVPAPIPLPASIWLLGTALGGLALRGRMRRPAKRNV